MVEGRSKYGLKLTFSDTRGLILVPRPYPETKTELPCRVTLCHSRAYSSNGTLLVISYQRDFTGVWTGLFPKDPLLKKLNILVVKKKKSEFRWFA